MRGVQTDAVLDSKNIQVHNYHKSNASTNMYVWLLIKYLVKDKLHTFWLSYLND